MSAHAPQPESPSPFAAAWADWHRAHEAARAAPHGFLSATALVQLDERPQPVPGLPGLWRTGPAGPAVSLGPGERLDDPAGPITGEHAFGPTPAGDRLVPHGELRIELLRRGGQDLVRPRDPAAPLRAQHPGTPTFPPSEDWVVPGRFEPFAEPRELTVGAALEGLEHVFAAPGVVRFERDGARHELTAFAGASGALLVLFRDETSGRSTYPLARSLAIAAPGPDGAVTLDFTRAVNLPCAYTDHAACPLPPRENRLALAVTAGERTPALRGTAAGVVPQG